MTNDEMIMAFHRHPDDQVARFKRMLCALSIVRNNEPVGLETREITRLAREAYGHDVEPFELERDVWTLGHIGLIDIHEDDDKWHVERDCDFWPFAKGGAA
jgi:hypothetical protein